ncbi:MAG TPA: GTPase Era [Kiloniellales bacterium]|nr:GTPase Era [Kiloniellales bacterium]
MSEAAQRSAVVAVLGAPNAGKSTLVNALVGAKVSIVTHKVQTTRFRLRGLFTEGDTQLVFVDTPGIFQPKRRLERAMVAAAWSALADADVLIVVHDARRGETDAESQAILDGIAKAERKALVVLSKVDLVAKPKLMPLAERLSRHPAVDRIFMVSALNGDGVGDLRRHLLKAAAPGPWLFPEDELSDLPLRQTAAEITREKLFLQLHDELPYDLTVSTDSWEDFKNGAVRIRQTVTVAREGQRRIAIGTGGRTIKAVREAAQRELSAFLERPVHLFLEVKVKEDWAEDPEHYRAWGLDPKA